MKNAGVSHGWYRCALLTFILLLEGENFLNLFFSSPSAKNFTLEEIRKEEKIEVVRPKRFQRDRGLERF